MDINKKHIRINNINLTDDERKEAIKRKEIRIKRKNDKKQKDIFKIQKQKEILNNLMKLI